MSRFSWKVHTVIDNGPREFYRYHVDGLILDDGVPPRRFSWSVPSLDNPTFDVSEAKTPSGEPFTSPTRAEEET